MYLDPSRADVHLVVQLVHRLVLFWLDMFSWGPGYEMHMQNINHNFLYETYYKEWCLLSLKDLEADCWMTIWLDDNMSNVITCNLVG